MNVNNSIGILVSLSLLFQTCISQTSASSPQQDGHEYVDPVINAKWVLEQKEGSITFAVDTGLPSPENQYVSYSRQRIFADLLRDNRNHPADTSMFIAFSAGPDLIEKDFFETMISAFSNHRPVVLSPDVIWLIISQQFAHYVNENAEQLRDLIVSHDGVQTLTVKTDNDLLSDMVDWAGLLDGLNDQIRMNTRDGISDIITASFTTTGINERIASQAILMETVKYYFEYLVEHTACGIPSITLTGTSDDWTEVLEKTQKLSKYGLEWWTAELEPILKQFISASQGNPDPRFWQNIVKTLRPDEIRGRTPTCSFPLKGDTIYEPTSFDGWFLKFMPFDGNGRTPDKVYADHEMLPEYVKVEFKYVITDDTTQQDIAGEYQMELVAGIIGCREDPATGALVPTVGWMVRKGLFQLELEQFIQEIEILNSQHP